MFGDNANLFLWICCAGGLVFWGECVRVGLFFIQFAWQRLAAKRMLAQAGELVGLCVAVDGKHLYMQFNFAG